MTTKEFEEYLVSIGGLVSGYKVNHPPIVTNICECRSGWLGLIRDLINELIAEGWNKEIHQIKEKFGGLRFYTGGLTDEQRNIIRKYEELSYETCEVCGEPGKTNSDKRWIVTVCDEHNKFK